MNTENKLPVLRPEDKPAIPEPADTAAPAGGKASRWKRPETHEEKMLFWMRVTGICVILLAVLAGAAAVMLLLNLSPVSYTHLLCRGDLPSRKRRTSGTQRLCGVEMCIRDSGNTGTDYSSAR